MHAFAVVAMTAFYAYVKSKKRRQAALQRAENFDAIAFRCRLFGFDVDVQWLFPVVVLLLSVGSAQFAIFAAAVVIVIVTHELGHAMMARRLGGEAIRILLHSAGGATQFHANLSRRESALVAVAGPATGFVLSAVFALTAVAWPAFRASESYGDLLFISFGWSVMNVLPILPLDGGNLLATLTGRQTLTTTLSLLFAIAGAVIAGALNRLGAVLFFVVLAISNFLAIPRVAISVARMNRRFG